MNVQKPHENSTTQFDLLSLKKMTSEFSPGDF